MAAAPPAASRGDASTAAGAEVEVDVQEDMYVQHVLALVVDLLNHLLEHTTGRGDHDEL